MKNPSLLAFFFTLYLFLNIITPTRHTSKHNPNSPPAMDATITGVLPSLGDVALLGNIVPFTVTISMISVVVVVVVVVILRVVVNIALLVIVVDLLIVVQYSSLGHKSSDRSKNKAM